ncbi:MAG: hypothetical protein ACXQS2_04360 [Methermicoccaceae archaeon]
MYGEDMLEFMKDVEKTAVEVVEMGGDHVPIVFGKIDKIYGFAIPAVSRDVGTLIEITTEKLAMAGAVWIVVVGSFYRRKFEDAEEAKRFMENYRYGCLADDAKSDEILLITGFSIDGKKEMIVYRVVTDENGQRKLVREEMPEGMEFYSRFNPFER